MATTSESSRIRVAHVDDHDVFREGIAALLASDPGLELVWSARNAKEAGEIARTSRKADVVLMDIAMPGVSGIEATRAQLLADPDLQVLIFTMHAREEVVVQALLAGAAGFALKTQTFADVTEAIRTVAARRIYLAPEIPRSSLEEYNKRIQKISKGALDKLTNRERQVFELAVQNRSNVGIANELEITLKTVETHRTSINRKLGVHSTAELVRFAAEHGLLYL